MHLTILNTEKILYEQDVVSVSSINSRGKFDILAQHTNFISLIKEMITVKERGGEKREFPIIGGILKVKNGVVEVFVGVG